MRQPSRNDSITIIGEVKKSNLPTFKNATFPRVRLYGGKMIRNTDKMKSIPGSLIRLKCVVISVRPLLKFRSPLMYAK
jgi:hypothetical protein